MQAAILSAKLPHLTAWTEARRAAAGRYDELLSGIPGIITPKTREGARHVYHVYCIRAPRRDELQESLKRAGVDTTRHYPTPLPLLTAYRRLGYSAADFPIASRHAKEILSLPIYPEITDEQQAYVAEQIRAFYA